MMIFYWFILAISLIGFLGFYFYIYLLYHCKVNKAKLFQPEDWQPKLTIGGLISCIIFSVVPIVNIFVLSLLFGELAIYVRSGFWKISVCQNLFKEPIWHIKLKKFFNTPISFNKCN